MDWTQANTFNLPSTFNASMFKPITGGPTADWTYTGGGNSNNNSNFAFLNPDYTKAYNDYVQSHTTGGGDNGSTTDWSQFNVPWTPPTQAILKTGPQQGSIFNLNYDANGNATPVFANNEYWNTNPDNSFLAKFLLGSAAATGAAYAFPGGFGTPGVTGADGAFLGENMASGIPAWDAAATNAGLTLGTTAGTAGVTAATQAAGGAAGGDIMSQAAAALKAGGTALGQFLQTGGSVALNAIKALTGGGPGGGSPNLAQLFAALNGVNANNSAAGEFKNFYDTAMGRVSPFYDKLNLSYTDPSSYFNSPEFKALYDIDQMQALRTDSANGSLSNDTSRTALLQKLAYQHLNDYRSGLSQDYSISQNAANQVAPAWLMGSILKANQWNPLANYFGNTGFNSGGSGSQGIPNINLGSTGTPTTSNPNYEPGGNTSSMPSYTPNDYLPSSGFNSMGIPDYIMNDPQLLNMYIDSIGGGG